MKKGRHRRFEEARAMKRSADVDLEALMESLEEERSSGNRSHWSEDDNDDD